VRSGPLRHKWFAWFTATVTSGSIGDEIMRLALPLLVLDLTHDIGAAATLRVIESVPYVLFGAFAGALIDRSEKRRLLAITTVLSVICTAFIPISVDLGWFSLGLLYAVSFLLGTLEVVWGITSDFSVVPALVEPEELTSANATYLTADRVARIVGPTLGGFAVALGVLVDDAIIDVENVVRRLRLNRNAAKPRPPIEVVFHALFHCPSAWSCRARDQCAGHRLRPGPIGRRRCGAR